MTMMSANSETTATARPPQPAGLPILGNFRQLTHGDMYKTFLDLHREYGDIFYLNVLNQRQIYVVRDPASLQHVLQMNNKNYVKGDELDPVRPLIGNGLFTSQGDYWRRQRRMMQPAFHRKHIALLADEMISTTGEMVQRWIQRRDPEEPLYLQNEMMALTMEIVTRTLFTNSLTQVEIAAMSDNIGFLLKTVTERAERIFDFTSRLPLPRNRRFAKGVETLDALVYRLITDRRRSGAQHDDLLDMLLTAEDADTGERMTDEQVRDEVVTMFLAGHETTAIALSWAFALLSLHPHVRRNLQAEVDAVLSGRQPGAQDFPELTYTQAVFQEALRLYAPLPVTQRTAVERDVLGGYPIPAGSSVILNFYGVHHHPRYWPNPEGFDPERFLPGREQARPRYAYVPFGGGPRQCIGNNFALMEGTMALAMISQRFDLDLQPGTDLTPNAIGTLRPLSALPMQARLRT